MPVPTVLLRHTLPDGSWHVDWLIGRDESGRALLRSYHLVGSLLELEPGQSLRMEPMADHRPRYLAYEGPISGNRGHVVRLARGVVHQQDVAESGRGGETMRIDWRVEADGGAVEQVVRLGAGAMRGDGDSAEVVNCLSRNPHPPR